MNRKDNEIDKPYISEEDHNEFAMIKQAKKVVKKELCVKIIGDGTSRRYCMEKKLPYMIYCEKHIYGNEDPKDGLVFCEGIILDKYKCPYLPDLFQKYCDYHKDIFENPIRYNNDFIQENIYENESLYIDDDISYDDHE